MAVLKQIMTPHGVQADYHRIVKADVLANDRVILVHVAIYASAAARDAQSQPLWNEYVSIPFDALTNDPRDFLYPLLTAHADSYLNGGVSDGQQSSAEAPTEQEASE